ncbi:MAG: hypothetical protein DWQ05_07560 [Calditrichaeota bacterium]|nr:MAG: hypothetical protein DWQ05_07560 [Calditrichota bacterium]
MLQNLYAALQSDFSWRQLLLTDNKGPQRILYLPPTEQLITFGLLQPLAPDTKLNARFGNKSLVAADNDKYLIKNTINAQIQLTLQLLHTEKKSDKLNFFINTPELLSQEFDIKP